MWDADTVVILRVEAHSFGVGNEYPWTITGFGNRRGSSVVNRRTHGTLDSVE